jgi:hypothetical protein
MTKYKWKNQYSNIDNASKFHNKVKDIFVTDQYFKLMQCYQEINVAQLIPGYPHNNHHFDWYIEELQTIVELHGAQHYQVVNFGSIGREEAHRQFLRIRDRDNTKKTAALDTGFEYRDISYKEYKYLDAKRLKELIFYE